MFCEVLDKKSQEIFFQLKNFKEFYLAGGTALALQIGHRISVDFDLFSDKEINKKLILKVKQIFPGRDLVLSVNNPGELTLFIDEVKITFLHYPFVPIFKTVEYDKVKLLSIKEIAATKAYTIGRRGSFKDYVDIYFLVSENYVSLQKIIDIAEKKYNGEFNSRLFLEQLIYLNDIEDTEIKFLKNRDIDKKTIENFFTNEIKKIKL